LDQKHGVRYFNELTNMAQLTEEVGEVARIIARVMANNPKVIKIKI
jgi:NTP pyrophosphatase (non-canonical NTP hydrolase)